MYLPAQNKRFSYLSIIPVVLSVVYDCYNNQVITFYIIRHGAKEAVTVDPQLTDIGKKQAQFTGKHFKNIKINKVLTSPKSRTYETAIHIAKHHGLSVEIDERLRERMEWEEGLFEDFVSEWNNTDTDRTFRASNGVSSTEKGKMVREVLNEIVDSKKEGNFVIVTHGGTIGDLLRNLFDHSLLNHTTHPKHNVQYIEILECSITEIMYKDGKFELGKIGDIDHLPQPVL